MPRVALLLPLLALPVVFGACNGAAAQDQQNLGLRLFNQSCRVCHTKPQLVSPQYGPVLSKATLNGKADLVREVISNGTPRMPGFKHDFKPAEIDAIVAYIQSIPPPADTPPPAAKSGNSGGNSREAD